MACSCGGTCTKCRQDGGLLEGPSHAQGGIPAIIEAIAPSSTIAIDIPNVVSCLTTNFVAALKIIVATNRMIRNPPIR